MTSSGAAAGQAGSAQARSDRASCEPKLVARVCEVGAASPEVFLSLQLGGDAGCWDARALGVPQAEAHAGVAWSSPLTSELSSGALALASEAACRVLARLGVPALRALVAVPFDGAGGFVRIPRFAYAVTGDVGHLIAVGDPHQRDVDADLAALRRAWDAAVIGPINDEGVRGELLDDGRSRYRRLVSSALSAIAAGVVEKVVTARKVELQLDRAPDLRALFHALPRAHVARFLVEQGAEVFFGATPETLVQLADGVARADALAGSRPAPCGSGAENPAFARAVADELLASDKDQREHALVVAFLRRALAGLGALTPESEPMLVRLPSVWHLHTSVGARTRPGVRASDLVAALHPTPAVLGVPSSAARAWLAEHEGFPRGLFAGSIGTLDASGEGTFVVGIRSARLSSDALTGRQRASLYAGGGIVAGSDVEKELDETEAKLAPMRRVLGCPGIAQ